MSFFPVDETALTTLQHWYDIEELPHRMERETPCWLEYVCKTPGVYAWMIYEDANCVGHVAVDTFPNYTACFGFSVHPHLRNRGYGRRILHTLIQRQEMADIKHIKVGVEHDNIASQKCLTAVGFVRKAPEPEDEEFIPNENYWLYVYTY